MAFMMKTLFGDFITLPRRLVRSYLIYARCLVDSSNGSSRKIVQYRNFISIVIVWSPTSQIAHFVATANRLGDRPHVSYLLVDELLSTLKYIMCNTRRQVKVNQLRCDIFDNWIEHKSYRKIIHSIQISFILSDLMPLSCDLFFCRICWCPQRRWINEMYKVFLLRISGSETVEMLVRSKNVERKWKRSQVSRWFHFHFFQCSTVSFDPLETAFISLKRNLDWCGFGRKKGHEWWDA